MEGVEVFEALAGAHDRDRHADDRHHRERGAAARVAVDLREHHAGHADLAVELAGAPDGVLPRHGVGDVEQVRGLRDVLDGDQFAHQLVVDVQAAGGVDDDHVAAGVAGFDEGAARARHRVEIAGRIEHPHTGLAGDDRELFDGGRAAHVGRDDQRELALFGQHPRQLAGGGRLARALQAEHEDDLRARTAGRKAAPGVAEEREQFVADDLDDLLVGAETGLDVLRRGPIADAIDEGLDHLQVDVGFDEGDADFAQHPFSRLWREADFASQGLKDVLQAVTQGVEHTDKPLSYWTFRGPVKPWSGDARASASSS